MHFSTALDELAFGWGLAGGFSHCIGMCGVFVAAYSGMPNAQRKPIRLEPHGLFHAGRLISLAALGFIAGSLRTLTHQWPHAQGAIGLAAGMLMVLLALGMAGILPGMRIPEPDILGAGGGLGRKMFRAALRSQSRWRPLGLGVIVGLLPCGLTYNALCAGLTLTPVGSAGLMLCFGLGTVPGLLALGLFGGAVFGGLLVNMRFRRGMNLLSAALTAVIGAALIARAIPSLLA